MGIGRRRGAAGQWRRRFEDAVPHVQSLPQKTGHCSIRLATAKCNYNTVSTMCMIRVLNSYRKTSIF